MQSLTNLLVVLLLLVPPALADMPDEPVGNRTHRTPSFTAGGADSCLVCHSGEKMRAIAAGVHGDATHPGSPASGRQCEACHGPGSIHASRAHGGRGFPPLTTFGRGSSVSPREDQIAACQGCHANADIVSEPIAFFGSFHDRRTINCSTCHQVHAEVDPIRQKEHQADTCFRCHRRQREEHPRFEGKSIDFDALSCWTCHDVHAVVDAEE